MSRSKVSGTCFSDAPANPLPEIFRRLIDRAVSLATRVILRTDPKSISAILYDCSPGAPPFFIRSALDASTSSVQFEFTLPIAVRHESVADVTTDLIVESPSTLSHSSVPSSPVSMQIDFGPGPLVVTNRTSGDLFIALHATGSSSLPSVASPSLQNFVGALRSPVDETGNNNPELVAYRALRTHEHSEAFGLGASPMSDARQLNPRIKIEELRPSRADDMGAVAQQKRASHSHQQHGQSHGPLTIHEYSEPLDHSGPGSRYPDRHGFRHAPQPKDEDVHEPRIAAQIVQPQRGFTTGEQCLRTSVESELLNVNTAEGFAEFLSNIDDFTCANLHRRGRLAQRRRGVHIAPSLESSNQISNQTQSMDTSATSSSTSHANLDSELTGDPAHRPAEEVSELLTQDRQIATELTPTLSPPTIDSPSIGELPFESSLPTQNASDDARRSWRTDKSFDLLRQMFDARRRSREVRDVIAENVHLEEGFGDFGEAFEGRWWM